MAAETPQATRLSLESLLDHLAYCLAEVSSPKGFNERAVFFPDR